MAKAGKVILIGCGSIVLLGVLAVAGVALYLRAHGDELMAQGKAVRDQGREAGAKIAGTGCVDAALAHLDANRSFTGVIESRLWFDGCLEASDPGEALCQGVPPETEIMASVGWRLDQCKAHGHANDNNCSNVMAAVQSYCEARHHAPSAPPAG